jgi:hypothetical protein
MLTKILAVSAIAVFAFTPFAAEVSGADSSSAPDVVSSASKKKEWETVTAAGITFKWRADSATLSCEVTAPTTGWVSVGFAPSKMMKDADIIIGYVSGTEVTIEDHFGTGIIAHKSDTALGGADNLTGKKGIERNDTTTIGFTMPLNSGDRNDKALEKGREYKIILAYGPRGKDNAKSKHGKRGSAKIRL